jgi:hypothetical protein
MRRIKRRMSRHAAVDAEAGAVDVGGAEGRHSQLPSRMMTRASSQWQQLR